MSVMENTAQRKRPLRSRNEHCRSHSLSSCILFPTSFSVIQQLSFPILDMMLINLVTQFLSHRKLEPTNLKEIEGPLEIDMMAGDKKQKKYQAQGCKNHSNQRSFEIWSDSPTYSRNLHYPGNHVPNYVSELSSLFHVQHFPFQER